jgi:hypothetical protein
VQAIQLRAIGVEFGKPFHFGKTDRGLDQHGFEPALVVMQGSYGETLFYSEVNS